MYLGIGGGITIDVKHALDSEPLERYLLAVICLTSLILEIIALCSVP